MEQLLRIASHLVGDDQYYGRYLTMSDLNEDGFSDLTVWGAPGPYFGSAAGLLE